MKRIVSTCLFGGPQATRHRTASGPSDFYRRYLPAWVRAHHGVFCSDDGWELRIHVDDELDEGLYGKELRAMAADNLLTIVECGEATNRNAAMLWRLKPLWEPDVEAVICRDLDSLPTPRDKACVDAWLDGDKAVHGINDSISHLAPLMGGMCGFRPRTTYKLSGLDSWEALIERASEFPFWDTPGSDQLVIENLIWRHAKHNAVVHVMTGPATRREWYAHAIDYSVAGTRRSMADTLIPHLGASGFDHTGAEAYWKKHGDQEIEWRIGQCEGLAVDREIDVSTSGNGERRSDDRPLNGPAETAEPPMRRVILACDANLNYATTLPLTCAVWKHRIGYTPSVFLVGTITEWMDDDRLRCVAEAAAEAGAEIHWLGSFEEITGPDGYNRCTFAQVVRLVACAMDWPEDDYLLTADAEMWGLDKAYFNRAIDPEKFDLYSPDCYAHEEKHRETMNYLGGTVRMWRKLLAGGAEPPPARLRFRAPLPLSSSCGSVDTTRGTTETAETARETASGARAVARALVEYLDAELGRGKPSRPEEGPNQWDFDERGFTTMLDRTDWYPDRCRMLGRTPHFWKNNSPGSCPIRRIERAEPWDGRVDGKIDANLPYLGTKPDVRDRCLEVFEAAFRKADAVRPARGPRPKRWFPWAQDYARRMAELLEEVAV